LVLGYKLKEDIKKKLDGQPKQAGQTAYELIWADSVAYNMYRLLAFVDRSFGKIIEEYEIALRIRPPPQQAPILTPGPDMIGKVLTVLNVATQNPAVEQAMHALDAKAKHITNPAQAMGLFAEVMGNQQFMAAIAATVGQQFQIPEMRDPPRGAVPVTGAPAPGPVAATPTTAISQPPT